jgi:hypothetical protein
MFSVLVECSTYSWLSEDHRFVPHVFANRLLAHSFKIQVWRRSSGENCGPHGDKFFLLHRDREFGSAKPDLGNEFTSGHLTVRAS